MKKILGFLLVFTVILFAACSKDDNSSGGASAAVSTSLKQGTWRVTSYVDNGTDETSDFNGFNFTFNAGGTVNASNTAFTVAGTWSTGVDDSKHKLVLNFNTSSFSFFGEISEDWEIVTQSTTQISLKHVSGGSGQTDLLVFTKN